MIGAASLYVGSARYETNGVGYTAAGVTTEVVQAPLARIPVHVMQAPRVRMFGTHRARFVIAIRAVPNMGV